MKKVNLKKLNSFRRETKAREDINILPSGGYIGKIHAVMDCDTRCLLVGFEIDEGTYKGYFSNDSYLHSFLDDTAFVTYEPDRMEELAEFITALEESNPGYKFDGENEQEFVNKRIGVVIQRREIPVSDNCTETIIQIMGFANVNDIRSGQFALYSIFPLDERVKETIDYIDQGVKDDENVKEAYALVDSLIEYESNRAKAEASSDDKHITPKGI